MPREAPEIRLIRETLEGVLHPSMASTVFFEAIQAGGGSLPSGLGEALELVRGPLREALAERVGDTGSEPTITQLEHMLTAAMGAGRKPRKTTSRHDMVTQNVEVSDEILPVYVLSGGETFANTLRATIGPHVMTALICTNSEMLRSRLRMVAPAFVLIDASDFPAIEPAELVEELAPVPPKVIKAVWGTDLPYGQGLLDAAQRRGISMTPFDRSEGIAPLMDMIRSRRAP